MALIILEMFRKALRETQSDLETSIVSNRKIMNTWSEYNGLFIIVSGWLALTQASSKYMKLNIKFNIECCAIKSAISRWKDRVDKYSF